MPDLPSHLHPLFFGIQMWHLSSLPYIFTPQYLHICNIFARRKFVQIHHYNILIKDFKKSTRTSKKVSICIILRC